LVKPEIIKGDATPVVNQAWLPGGDFMSMGVAVAAYISQ
jgi:hypothetical protein